MLDQHPDQEIGENNSTDIDDLDLIDPLARRGPQPMVNVCKFDEKSGNWVVITVNGNALPALEAQGAVQLIDEDGDGFVSLPNACGIPVDCDDTDPTLTNFCDQIGIITGRIVDALTGNPIAGARIILGNPIETNSDSDGNFSLEVPEGIYNIIIQKEGNINVNISDFSVVGNQLNVLGIVAMSPILETGALRIVLTWNPQIDLDSHLTGPIPNTNSRFHVYWFSLGNLNSSPFSLLDRDDLFGPGPETITISETFDGIYRFSVHDYTNLNSFNSSNLSNSNAQVRVFSGNDQIASFTVPNQDGTLWKVFELNGLTKEITVFF
jgi:uncharacterized protein YfaP (DUF2135 family)